MGRDMSLPSNEPAAGNAGMAALLAIGYHWPSVPEPGRWEEKTI